MKLAFNMLIHGLNQTVSETLALTTGAGIDQTIMFDVIKNNTASIPMVQYRRPHFQAIIFGGLRERLFQWSGNDAGTRVGFFTAQLDMNLMI